jgi:hypothetical protein
MRETGAMCNGSINYPANLPETPAVLIMRATQR